MSRILFVYNCAHDYSANRTNYSDQCHHYLNVVGY